MVIHTYYYSVVTSETLYVVGTSGGRGRTLEQMLLSSRIRYHYHAAARLQMGSLVMASLEHEFIAPIEEQTESYG